MFPDKATIFNPRESRLKDGVEFPSDFIDKDPRRRRRPDAGEIATKDSGSTWIRKCFYVYINIGDDIPADSFLWLKRYVTNEPAQTSRSVQIYAGCRGDPGFADEDGWFMMGQKPYGVDMAKTTVEQRAMRYTLTFGGPEMTAADSNDTEGRETTAAVITLCWGYFQE